MLKNKLLFLFFAQYKNWVKQKLKLNNVILNKNKFHKFEESIDLFLVDVDQIVVLYKFKYNNEKHFMGYREGEIC